jgi:aspartyl-tRNA(Asn)/glutamyl-tRNA(Gln) amidotransferase subunit A
MAAETDLLDLWLGGDASAFELTAAALARIEACNPWLNAVITVMGDEARADASAIDARAARDGRMPPLRGMPVLLKDNIDVAGVRTTVASDFFRDHVPDADASVVTRLRAAGAVIVGKANLHEFVLGATGQSHHFGPCVNPWDAARVPGGSSSGSGVAVAARMCIAAIGSDTGGSIRNPAAFNNVVGLKPTHGRVSSRGSFAVSPPHDVLGPLACRVSDVAAVFDAIAGHDAADPTSEPRAFTPVGPKLGRGVKNMTIGIPRAFYYEDLDPGVAAAVEEAIAVLRALGMRTVEVTLDEAERAWHLCSRVLVMTDAAALHKERMETESQRMGRDVFARVAQGREVSGMQYADALRFREAWRVRVREAFAVCDAIITPTCPFPAPRIADAADMGDTSNMINRMNFTWSLAGVPALSVPCGLAQEMPVGVQIVAPWWQDARALRIGAAFQDATQWHLRAPPLAC